MLRTKHTISPRVLRTIRNLAICVYICAFLAGIMVFVLCFFVSLRMGYGGGSASDVVDAVLDAGSWPFIFKLLVPVGCVIAIVDITFRLRRDYRNLECRA